MLWGKWDVAAVMVSEGFVPLISISSDSSYGEIWDNKSHMKAQ